MVAKIKSGKSIIGAINYNERKVKLGKARLIGAPLYTKNLSSLSFSDKLFRLQDLAARNSRTKTNTMHSSLNFDPEENLTLDDLMKIAESYMEKIGFGNQPSLVYQHFDAGHPHIHIVTTNIEANGNRISMHNIGRLKSEPARKSLEIEFGLVQADLKRKPSEDISRTIEPITYGTTDLKRAMTYIVNEVIRQYKFTSLPELNAILGLYHIQADRGGKESIMYNRNGMRYWVTDKSGVRVGVPIKASAIYYKPTLKKLEDRFRLGNYLRKPFKNSIKEKVASALTKSGSFTQFTDELKKVHITALFRENNQGRLYGITFIDQKNKVVFKGSDLGNYSAAAVITAIESNPAAGQSSPEHCRPESAIQTDSASLIHTKTLLEELLNPIDQSSPENLFERKKRKKRKKLNL